MHERVAAAAAGLVCELIDWPTLKREPSTHVDDALEDRHTDLLYSVSLDGRQAFFYLLLEHQSKVAPMMARRLWRYKSDIWDRYVKDHPSAVRLPLILSMVLHHSDTGWTAATNIRDLFDITEETRAVLGELVPSMGFVLDDLSVQDDHALRARVMHLLPKLALWALKNVRNNADPRQALLQVVDLMRALAVSSGGVEALAIIFRYIILACEMEPEELSSFAWNEVNPKASEAFMTTAEILEQRGEQRATLRTLRETLLRQLQKRFGEVPQAITERIRDAEPEKLTLWLDNFASAQSLSDVFA